MYVRLLCSTYHPLVLKAGHLSGSAFCWVDIGLPEQAMGLELIVEDGPTELSCLYSYLIMGAL